MKTVDKAMTVLDQFTVEQTEIGLSDLARQAGLDKAATRRLLVALGKHGFIEQSGEGRKYRLGHGFLRLARVREATVPLARAAQDVADWVLGEVNETAHVNVPSAQGLSVIAHRLPSRGNIISLNPAELLPFHATSAGIAYLAWASPGTRDAKLQLERAQVTPQTKTAAQDVLALAEDARAKGFAEMRNSFDEGVSSIAMAFFAGGVDPAGTISIALPDAALDAARRDALLPVLQGAIARMEQALLG